MAYSELIKNFDRIRDYMRQFYVYGFKSRNEYDKKSARSYVKLSFRASEARREIFTATSALNSPVAELLHCSAESLRGKMSFGSSHHSCTLPLSFLRLSMQFTARSISISGHLALFMISLVVSSFICSETKAASFSISTLDSFAKLLFLYDKSRYICVILNT